MSNVDNVENLSTPIVDNSKVPEKGAKKGSYPHQMWITRWKNV
jgi:hypothetical protein